MVKAFLLLIFLSFCINAWSADPPLTLYDEGVKQGVVFNIDCSGSGIACTKSGITGTISASGGGSGSGTVGIGTTGWMPYYASSGATVNATSVIQVLGNNIGVGTSTANNVLTVSAATTSAGGVDLNNNGATGAGGCDAYSTLILAMEGSNAGTSFMDTECVGSAKSITANGNAQTSTAQKKFGSSSYLGDGTGDFLSGLTTTDLSTGSVGFTVDFWIYPNDVSVAQSTIVWSVNDSPTFNDYCRMIIGLTNNGDIALICDVGGGAAKLNFRTTSGGVVTTGSWQHIELAVDTPGNAGYIFVDGVSKALTLSVGAYNNSLITASRVFSVGGRTGGIGSLNGYLDEFRFSKGIVRHTSNFTPNTLAYSGIGPSVINFKSQGVTQFSLGNDYSGNSFKLGTTSPTTGTFLTVTSGGNTGIGDSTPEGTLEVVKSGSVQPFQVSSSSTGVDGDYFVIDSGGNVGIGTTAPRGALIIMNGNVGIGTWSPTSKLQAVGIGTTAAQGLCTAGNGKIGTFIGGTFNGTCNIP